MKSRDLPNNYLGLVNDKLYNSNSSGANPVNWDLSEEACLALYEAYKATRNVSTTTRNIVGKEIFDSTTRERPLMNNCYHSKVVGYNVPFGLWKESWNTPTWAYRTPYYRYSSASYPLLYASMAHISTDGSGAARRAWWHMQPRFEGEVSMLNFLFELRDFKQIMKHVVSPKLAYHKINTFLYRLGRKGIPKSGDPTKGAAGLYLTGELALKPLLSDLASIHAQLATLVREAQANFKSAGSEDQKSHFSEVLADETYALRPGYYNNYSMATGSYRKTLFTATMHYQYAYKMRNTVDAFVKYWGLYPNVENFWNSIPWSFVVDYFLGIGKSLHAMAKDSNVQLRTTDYAESLLTEASTGIHLYPDERILGCVIDENYTHLKYPQLVAGMKGTLYERATRTPNYGPALPKIKLPTARKWLTMGALVRCLL